MPREQKKIRPTKLISILTRVLDWVQSKDYEDFGKYMIFGTSELAGHSNARIKGWLEASKALNEYSSRVRVSRRVSLSRDPDLKGHLEKAGLSDYGWEYVNLVLGGRAPNDVKLSEGGHDDPTSRTDIEMHFANEFVNALPKVVKRAESLEEIDDQQIGKGLVPDSVRKYFGEAHRCYLYGSPVACAVLCRAILESALVEVVDPKGRIEELLEKEARNSGKPKQSYIQRLVEEAQKKNILADDRPRCAIQVRDAGNDAIHDYKTFEERLRELGGIAYIVDSTRKVLIDLYSCGS